MAVQKSKVSRSKRDMRRGHDSLSSSTLSIDKYSGEKHRRHHVSAQGYLRGKKVVATADENYDEDED